MELFWFIILAVAAFCLGSCPFAVWIGRWKLGKDIREYGDHNPGAANVFKAGSIKWGFVAAFLDIAKGVPFVLLAHLYFHFNEPQIYLIGLCAIAGHAFSPFLRFKGGKATGVTMGVLLSIPPKDILLIFCIMMVLCFFLLDGDGWRIVLSTAACLIYSLMTGKTIWTVLLFAVILVIVSIKNREALESIPRRKKKIYIGFGQQK